MLPLLQAGLLLAGTAAANTIVNLTNAQWTVSNSGTSKNISIPGSFPSQTHVELYKAGKIADPLFGFNDVDQLWVQAANWTWQSKPITGLQSGSQTWLVFEGLDTFTQIKLCGQEVANTNNMYRKYSFDVTNALKKCQNGAPDVSLNFGSASAIVLEIAKTGPAYINSTNGVTGKQFQGMVYARKEQNDMGWDWSPAIAPAGPWRPGYFVQKATQDPVVVDNTLIDVYRKGQMNNLAPDQSQPWVFNASIDYLGTLPKDAKMHLDLLDASGKNIQSADLANITSNSMTITGNTMITAPVDLWWPHGMGSQTLYSAVVTITSGSWSKAATVTKRIGFRTVVLNLNQITSAQQAKGIAPGSNWHFEVNGQAMYAKGANLVPMDVLWTRVNSTKIHELFELAVNANYNMFRVWASGAYLADEIYDMADEMGIFLWSEFEFSDAQYPVVDDFLKNYEAEAYYNVRRVNHHPSLALWAGGNELEAIILAYFNYPGEVRDGYEKLCLQLLIKCVYANTRSISYIPSSTYNGYTKLDFSSVMPQTPRYALTNGSNYLYSNTDAYNTDATQAFNNSARAVGRFATEFGTIAFPSLQSWRNAISESDLYVESPSVLHHNRHYPFGQSASPEGSLAGINDSISGIKLWYPQPSLSDKVANFSAWCWTSQLYQADKYVSEIAFYRRGSAHKERQLGSLFWQFNDVWVAPTWAAVESSGRTKVMYHATKDIYTPVIVWPYYEQDSDSLDIWVISDKPKSLTGKVDIQWMDWSGKNLSNSALDKATGGKTHTFNVGALNGTQVLNYTKLSSLFASSTDLANAVLSLSLTSNSGDTHTSWLSAVPLVKAAVKDPGLQLVKPSASKGASSVEFQITATKAVASKVWLDYPSTVRGYFDKNGFWLNKGETKKIEFTIWNDFTGDGSWINDVSVRSIWDNTQKS